MATAVRAPRVCLLRRPRVAKTLRSPEVALSRFDQGSQSGRCLPELLSPQRELELQYRY